MNKNGIVNVIRDLQYIIENFLSSNLKQNSSMTKNEAISVQNHAWSHMERD